MHSSSSSTWILYQKLKYPQRVPRIRIHYRSLSKRPTRRNRAVFRQRSRAFVSPPGRVEASKHGHHEQGEACGATGLPCPAGPHRTCWIEGFKPLLERIQHRLRQMLDRSGDDHEQNEQITKREVKRLKVGRAQVDWEPWGPALAIANVRVRFSLEASLLHPRFLSLAVLAPYTDRYTPGIHVTGSGNKVSVPTSQWSIWFHSTLVSGGGSGYLRFRVSQ
jgi:hypothetical protein